MNNQQKTALRAAIETGVFDLPGSTLKAMAAEGNEAAQAELNRRAAKHGKADRKPRPVTPAPAPLASSAPSNRKPMTKRERETFKARMAAGRAAAAERRQQVQA